jgi:hypothetical protein
LLRLLVRFWFALALFSFVCGENEMYIDPVAPRAPSMKTEQDVNEATAALKGLLGLGGNKGGSGAIPDAVASFSETTTITPSNTNHTVEAATIGGGNTKKKRNNNSNKKKKNQDISPRKEPDSNIKDKPNDSDKNDIPAPAVHQPPSKRKRKPRKKPNKEEEPENYALSAFQSSPDASKLPIPEFTLNQPQQQPQVPPTTAISSVDEVEIISEHSSEPEVDVADYDHINDKKDEIIDTAIIENNQNENGVAAESRNDDVPLSATGVNLAALTAKPPQQAAGTPPIGSTAAQQAPQLYTNGMSHPQDPRMHLNQLQLPPPYGAGLPANGNSHISPTQMLPFPPPHHPLMGYPPNYQYQAPIMHHQHIHHMPTYPPPPPPGYILLQVQVPPGLLPGRQMIVSTPSGFPLQVVVPDGIPAGAWIPVHVPANPPHHPMHPHHIMQHQQQIPQPPIQSTASPQSNSENPTTPPGNGKEGL